MNVAEIYQKLGQSIVDSIENDWVRAELNIEYSGGSVKFNLEHFDAKDKQGSCFFVDGFQNMRAVKKLHQITTENDKNKWNKAVFTLLRDGSFDMKFTWDQELQDELDSFMEK